MTIKSFIKIFKNSYSPNTKLIQYLPLMKKYEFSNFNSFIKTDNSNYCRNTIFRNDQFEILILSWLPGQKTSIHYHPNNGCLMKILKGQLHETKFTNNAVIEEIYKQNDTSYIHNDIGKHIIYNNSKDLTVSLHIYSPPNFYKNN
jgi:cysteine dioxygenase